LSPIHGRKEENEVLIINLNVELYSMSPY